MDIGVGEWVRTNKGYIFHDLSSRQISGLKLLNEQYGNIAKHSKNLIDLIEVGDFVNGQLIEKIHRKEKDRIYYEFLESEDGSYEVMQMCLLDNIKTILTHEQYERNCYRLEE